MQMRAVAHEPAYASHEVIRSLCTQIKSLEVGHVLWHDRSPFYIAPQELLSDVKENVASMRESAKDRS